MPLWIVVVKQPIDRKWSDGITHNPNTLRANNTLLLPHEKIWVFHFAIVVCFL
jgi:hypothetical protein